MVRNKTIKKAGTIWFKLVGSRLAFSIESRIFHSVSLSLIMLSALYIPYNFFAGLHVASISCLVICLFFLYQYYYSRFHGQKHSSTVFGIMGIILFSINYFANAGISGSTDIIWPVYLVFVLSISPYRQHMIWVGLYLLSFVILHLVAYSFPEWVQYPFRAGKEQLIDRITAFPLPIISIFILINFIRKSHDKERLRAEEKTMAAELMNKQILQQKKQLEQSNAEKNKLMSIISHDMRAPLANIQSYLELLTDIELDYQDRPTLERDLLTATNGTMQMLSNLLAWSKSQMEGQTVNLAEENLLSVLKTTLDIENMLAAKKNITLTYQIDPLITVTADSNMLQLVVRNLVNNAIKFTPQGGLIKINASINHNECEIAVRDNGVGIDEGKRDRIFSITSEPSYGTSNEKGVGLGLLLCKEYTELQGGRIGFESVSQKGSTFFIFIPLSSNAPLNEGVAGPCYYAVNSLPDEKREDKISS